MVPDDGDRTSLAGRNTSTLEKWMQGREDRRLKSAQVSVDNDDTFIVAVVVV